MDFKSKKKSISNSSSSSSDDPDYMRVLKRDLSTKPKTCQSKLWLKRLELQVGRLEEEEDASAPQQKEGIITKDGILCNCCDKIFNALDFEIHAGSDLKRPLNTLPVTSTTMLVLSARMEGTCFVAKACPSTYHQDCMAMEITGNAVKREETRNLLMSIVLALHFATEAAKRCGVGHSYEREWKRKLSLVFDKLEKMVGVRKELDEGFTWTLLRRMDQEFGVRVNDLYQMIECHSKLAIARIVIEECFETITDRHTRINVLQNVVYNCEIHGTKLAEMPFVATLENYRSQGMCRRLMVAIESALCYFKVESLVIPSIHETIGSWIDRFGFKHIDRSMINELRMDMEYLDIP
ncbi:acyl-CoA N-acyltransferase with RING/FYVE/PHD-type zinc finger protein [Actinidia rufa]|uniref:Acyl-CoA N-acyltransferase with RING/FYVE/PHD-type zinc finger protein n=1 Tax=Actinidia rufa TaxID=165716 RepID=A0A7J0GX51_9ERIC|nr:acyl-CoA N-acyltransferase with RING/FYVE/PHD-type zinc finger protein [Actinidia rufa]